MANLKDINYGIGKYLELSDASAIPGIGNNRKNLDLLNFKVAVNNTYNLYNFKDGMIDAYQTEDGVDTSNSTNYVYNSTNKYYEVGGPPTGGATSTYSTYTVHSFLSSDDFVVKGSGTVDALVVGAGGGSVTSGGRSGGGAGGFRTSASHAVTGQTYAITVGAGGIAAGWGGMPVSVDGGPMAGGSSTFDTITSAGGGRGASASQNYDSRTAGGRGGSGGGASEGGNNVVGAGNYPSTSPSQGNPGGLASGTSGSSHVGAGGGGGAGAAGSAAYGDPGPGGKHGGPGGVGLQNDYRTGSNVYYAGGGGGNQSHPSNDGAYGLGGNGGGGNGGDADNSPAVAQDGTANSGGGAGGGGADGGSGIVVIRYTTGALGDYNMTLKSNAQAAQADPTEGRLMLYEEDVDAITLDTDLKGYVSRDGGTTYTQTPLVEDTVYGQWGMDQYTKLMLHCDGSNGGTTFTDSSDSSHIVTANGNAHTDTAIKKFGTASAQFDGTGDYLSTPDSSDWNFGTDNFTAEAWFRASSLPGSNGDTIVGQSGSNTDNRGWAISIRDTSNSVTNPLKFMYSTNGTSWSSDSTGGTTTIVVDTWYHVAVVRSGTTFYLFVNGAVEDTWTDASSMFNCTADLEAGSTSALSEDFNGYIDEIRISKGVARWTAAFTPPTNAYGNPLRLLSGSVDISGQPAGSNMKYKVETLNDKNLKLHGASLLWA